MEVATRGRRGLPLPTLRIPEMQIRLNYHRIVNPFRGDLQYCGGREDIEAKRRDNTRQRRGREKERFYVESTIGTVQSLTLCTHIRYVHVHRRAYQHDTDGCIVWVHCCTCASPRRCGCMMYNRHRGLCSGEYANQYARPGSDLSLWLVPSSATHGSHWRNETVNTEGSRKSCTCIYSYIPLLPVSYSLSYCVATRLTLLTYRPEGKNPSRVTEETIQTPI